MTNYEYAEQLIEYVKRKYDLDLVFSKQGGNNDRSWIRTWDKSYGHYVEEDGPNFEPSLFKAVAWVIEKKLNITL